MTRRLMLWLTAATILFWVAAAGVGAMVMREEFDEVFDSALQETAQRLMPLVVNSLFQRESSDDPWSVDGSSAGEPEYLDVIRSGIAHATRPLALPRCATRPFNAPLKRRILRQRRKPDLHRGGR